MNKDSLNQRLKDYQNWRERLAETIHNFHTWLDEHKLASPEQELRLFEAVDALRKDQLTIAFVAEFSRGKTELINALFFSEYGQRLLPSEAGRTTMCPTELFYDHSTDRTYIRLLPIESRRDERSIADLKHEPIQWTQIGIDPDSPGQTADALKEVVRTKMVPIELALELGLYNEAEDSYFKLHGKRPAEVEVPYWRHALISFPHELLKRGLVILDTPGLNTLGNEPELTLNMLPSAQAVFFILAADTGVTRSDMDIWDHHVRTVRERRDAGLTVVLNKIDTLWDELKSDEQVRSEIERQRRITAEQLRVPPNQVFPLSAKKGLHAKIKADTALLQASRLPALEHYLSDEVLPSRQALVKADLVARVGGMLDEHLNSLKTRETAVVKQLDELRSIRGKNADVIMHLVNKTQEEKDAYLRNVESFQSSRGLIQNQGIKMMEALSIEALDKLISETRESMKNSWTTTGLKHGMETFFDGARDAMEQVTNQAEQTRLLIRATYRKFHKEHGLPEVTPRPFNISQFSSELERLYHEAENFRRSPVTTMTEQSFVIKKFFISLVSHARSVFFKANKDADNWLKEVMTPLVKQIKEHKSRIEKRLDTLHRVSESRDTVDARIKELEAEYRDNRAQLKMLKDMRDSLDGDTPPPKDWIMPTFKEMEPEKTLHSA